MYKQLYSLYLTPNFDSIIAPLYINSTSTTPFVRLAVAHELRTAAQTELLKHHTIINPSTIYTEAEEAFRDLANKLGKDRWFFGEANPGLFDAAVFAYTHLLLDQDLGVGWQDKRLQRAVNMHDNLVQHRNRIWDLYFKA